MHGKKHLKIYRKNISLTQFSWVDLLGPENIIIMIPLGKMSSHSWAHKNKNLQKANLAARLLVFKLARAIIVNHLRSSSVLGLQSSRTFQYQTLKKKVHEHTTMYWCQKNRHILLGGKGQQPKKVFYVHQTKQQRAIEPPCRGTSKMNSALVISMPTSLR